MAARFGADLAQKLPRLWEQMSAALTVDPAPQAGAPVPLATDAQASAAVPCWL
jgi:hypothetical protein